MVRVLYAKYQFSVSNSSQDIGKTLLQLPLYNEKSEIIPLKIGSITQWRKSVYSYMIKVFLVTKSNSHKKGHTCISNQTWCCPPKIGQKIHVLYTKYQLLFSNGSPDIAYRKCYGQMDRQRDGQDKSASFTWKFKHKMNLLLLYGWNHLSKEHILL